MNDEEHEERIEYISTDEVVECENCGRLAYGPGTDRTAKQELESDEQRAQICLTLKGNFIHTPEQLSRPIEGDIIGPDGFDDVTNPDPRTTRSFGARVNGHSVIVQPTEFEVIETMDD
jgi:hypothetical protein